MRMKKWMTWLIATAAATTWAAPNVLIIEAENAQFDSSRAEIVERGPTFRFRKGVMLKSGVKSNIANPTGEPDLTFQVQIPQTGRYEICSFADATGAAREAMRVAGTNKYASLRMMIAVDDDFPRNLVLFPPWGRPDGHWSHLMRVHFTPGKHIVRVWLPENSALDRLDFVPYQPPKVPEAARNYVPKLVPPASHPRLWCNAETLPQVRANLEQGENRPLWEAVRKAAAVPYQVKPTPPRTAVDFNRGLQDAALIKAFVYLMTGDREFGEEAVKIIYPYMTKVEFGMLDARDRGTAVYHGSLVYDWCYDLLTPKERTDFRKALMRLADGMEIGWPPFGQMIVNGHGNEGDVNRDLLAMSIALYGEYNIPYQYCAYRILEELVPMRRFEYPCGRHNQGSLYGGSVRYGNELLGALLLYRMSGKRVYDESFGRIFYYFIYGRTPGNTILPDGDAHWSDRPWIDGVFAFHSYIYSEDPVFRGFFDWLGGGEGVSGLTNKMRFLLMNDPAKRERKDIATLPLTFYGDGEIPSMIARTGWNFGKDSRDAWVDMKGGGYNVINHQHADAGAFQIYYRGWLATDLGIYSTWGAPYDFGYNKRSIAHNVMLAYWPEEKFLHSDVNDGGQRMISDSPSSLQQLLRDPQYKVGNTVAADFGPDKTRPLYNYFKTNLTLAYHREKMKSYTRTFCFLNQGEVSEPAALITVDRMTTARPEYKKYWLFNSLTEPKISDNTALVTSDGGGRVKVQMLLPRKVKIETASKGELANVFGTRLPQPPDKLHEPTANGWRMMFSPTEANATDLFVSVMQIGDAKVEPPPVNLEENAENCQITIANRVVVLGTSEQFAKQPFAVQLPQDCGEIQLLLSDLKPGAWNIRSADGKIQYNFAVAAGKSTAFLLLPGGQYKVSPGAVDGAPRYEPPQTAAPPQSGAQALANGAL